MSDLTLLLAAARQGQQPAVSTLFELLYDDLHRLARSRLRQHQTMTLLDTTSLLHESFLKLIGSAALPIEDRQHFFAYAARVMRSVIVDFARARRTERQGGNLNQVTLEILLSQQVVGPEDDALRIHEALDVLEKAVARLARVVEMRYFGGLTEAEIAQALGISDRTVRREWEKARLLLKAVMS